MSENDFAIIKSYVVLIYYLTLNNTIQKDILYI